MAGWWIVGVDDTVLGFRVAPKKYCSHCPTNCSAVTCMVSRTDLELTLRSFHNKFRAAPVDYNHHRNEMRGRGPYEETYSYILRIWIRFLASQTATRVEYYPRVLFQGSCKCIAQHPRNYLAKQDLICAPRYAESARMIMRIKRVAALQRLGCKYE